MFFSASHDFQQVFHGRQYLGWRSWIFLPASTGAVKHHQLYVAPFFPLKSPKFDRRFVKTELHSCPKPTKHNWFLRPFDHRSYACSTVPAGRPYVTPLMRHKQLQPGRQVIMPRWGEKFKQGTIQPHGCSQARMNSFEQHWKTALDVWPCGLDFRYMEVKRTHILWDNSQFLVQQSNKKLDGEFLKCIFEFWC